MTLDSQTYSGTTFTIQTMFLPDVTVTDAVGCTDVLTNISIVEPQFLQSLNYLLRIKTRGNLNYQGEAYRVQF